jgi:2,4-dienoyl-CoA reductase-like NADH-dependent reductase (Old Yellow Enzyme family)
MYATPKKIKNLEIKNRFVRSATARKKAKQNQ